MSDIPTSETLLSEITLFCESEFRRRAERFEPLTRETVNAIRDAATLRLVSRINELEFRRDAAFRKTERIGDALEASSSIRASLNTH